MEKVFLEQIKEIYGLLGDDLSKEIYGDRLLYSLTGDAYYMRKIICMRESGKEMYLRMKNTDKCKVIFGAGILGEPLPDIYDDIEFTCFVDNNHAGESCNGLPIIDVQTLKKEYKDAMILIATSKYHAEILEQLLSEGFQEENIINIGKAYAELKHQQYFDLPELRDKKEEKEVLIDGGCYDGANSLDFQKWCMDCGVKEQFAYIWEPEPKNVGKCKEALDNAKLNYKMIPKGLWSQKAELCFDVNETSTTVSENGTIKIDVDSIDNVVDGPVTFIKMDIEGSEYQALCGAEETIKKYKPKMAICIYHKPEDIWELPQLIYQFNPEYKFYVRHYSFADNETVLYAISNDMDE